jgi:hypothetical protein
MVGEVHKACSASVSDSISDPPAGLMLGCGGIVGIVVLFVLLAPAV